MIVIDLLRYDSWENVSPAVEIAKGSHELPTTWKKTVKHLKRQKNGR